MYGCCCQFLTECSNGFTYPTGSVCVSASVYVTVYHAGFGLTTENSCFVLDGGLGTPIGKETSPPEVGCWNIGLGKYSAGFLIYSLKFMSVFSMVCNHRNTELLC